MKEQNFKAFVEKHLTKWDIYKLKAEEQKAFSAKYWKS
jgi:hypothetical protein